MDIFSPLIKAIVTITSIFISGLLCSSIINSITVGNDILWGNCIEKIEFWIMVVYSTLFIIYTYFSTKNEINLRKKIDDEYYYQLYKQNQIGLIVTQQNEAIQNNDLSKFCELDSILNIVRSKGK